MVDFEEMASKAKKDAEARAAAEAKKSADDSAANLEQMKAGATVLQRSVLPLLQRAQEAFAKTGVPCVIDTEFDVSNTLTRKPQVVFRCAGPAIENRRGGKSQAQSVPVFFESDGETIDVGLGKYPGSNYPEINLGSSGSQNIEELVKSGVQAALDSYYAEVDQLRQTGLWT